MLVTLRVVSGPEAHRKASVRGGQVLRVGRTEWSDFALTEDSALADVHFALDCTGGRCVLRDESEGPGLIVNDEPVEQERELRPGDRIRAGQSDFEVLIEGVVYDTGTGAQDQLDAEAQAAQAKKTYPRIAIKSALDVAKPLKWGEELIQAAEAHPGPREFVEFLLGGEQPAEAIRFLAHALPKREAIWWACLCVESLQAPTDDTQIAALAAAKSWVCEPEESARRAAEDVAKAAGLDSAAGLVAQATFWAEGSMAPADYPAMPSDPHMTAHALVGAIMMAAVSDSEADPRESMAAVVTKGVAVADGDEVWDTTDETSAA